MKNTKMALDLGELEIVSGGVMDENQKTGLLQYITIYKMSNFSEAETMKPMLYIIRNIEDFSGVTDEEVTELVHSAYLEA